MNTAASDNTPVLFSGFNQRSEDGNSAYLPGEGYKRKPGCLDTRVMKYGEILIA